MKTGRPSELCLRVQNTHRKPSASEGLPKDVHILLRTRHTRHTALSHFCFRSRQTVHKDLHGQGSSTLENHLMFSFVGAIFVKDNPKAQRG